MKDQVCLGREVSLVIVGKAAAVASVLVVSLVCPAMDVEVYHSDASGSVVFVVDETGNRY